jgi:hypothetical protein
MAACRYAGSPERTGRAQTEGLSQARPIRQKLCRFTPDKREAIRAELGHLVAAGFIREVLHPEWLANPVLILKKNKVDWHVHRLYRSQQTLSKGSLRTP